MPAIYDEDGNYIHDADPLVDVVLTTTDKLEGVRNALDALDGKATVADVIAALKSALG
jgi:hypothetical protein